MSTMVSRPIAATSPTAAGTEAGPTAANLGRYRSIAIVATLQGATGGTLDVYLQWSPDEGTTWVDYAHFPQLAAGAAVSTRVWTVSRAAQQLTLTTVGSGLTPALAANTIVGGEFGDRLRVVFVAGGGTSAGAAQSILIVGTEFQ